MNLGRGPLSPESQNLGGPGVRPSQIERSIGILRQGRRQLRLRDRRIPVPSAEMGITEVGETRAGVTGRQPGAHPAAATPRSEMAPARSST